MHTTPDLGMKGWRAVAVAPGPQGASNLSDICLNIYIFNLILNNYTNCVLEVHL